MACTKRRFPTAEAANAKLDAIDKERPRRPGRKLPIRAYKCPRCMGWHLTSQPKPVRHRKR